MKKILYLMLIGLLATASPVWGQPFGGGNGTATNPYLITSATDWVNLAVDVNTGTSYSGVYFKQTANISITGCVGDEAHAFSGTFDGNGYTIDMTFENVGILYAAPFRYIDGATIRGVHLMGTLSSTSQYAGCIVGYAKGTSTVTNCINSANITNKYSGGNAYDGGIVGQVSTDGSIINITNCLFNGTMSDEGNASNYENWNGILSHCNGNCTVNISNCLVDPVNTVTNGNTLYNGNCSTNCSNCYYTKTIGNAQGINGSNMTAAQLATALGDGWHVVNGKAVPYVVPFTLSQIPDGWTVTVNGVPVTVTNDTIVICAGNEVVFTPTYANNVKSVTIKNASATGPTINISATKQNNGTWKFAMPAANMRVEVEYFPYYTLKLANDGNGTAALVTPLPEDVTDYGNGTYLVMETVEVTVKTIANPYYHFANWNDQNTDNPRTITLTSNTTFTAHFAINEYRLDSIPLNWTVLINNVAATLTPYGTAHPDSGYVMIPKGANVKITPQPVAQAVKVEKLELIPINVSGIKSDSTVRDGDVLTGTLYYSGKISIADGATVILDNLTVENTSFTTRAGLNCLGDATIILKDGTVNNLTGSNTKAGIYVPAGHTLTICGTGTLNATGSQGAAGIGAGSSNSEPGGHIIITGGTITATGGSYAAGIGGGKDRYTGDITITGGTVTATGDENAAGIGGGWDSDNGTITIMGGTIIATGGENAPGIGAGLSGSGGNITITNTVTKVTAYKGNGEYQSDCDCIGKSYIGSCGTVTIDGTMYYNGTQYRNNGYSYLRQNTIIYPPQP